MIKEIRQRFQGSLILALYYPDEVKNLPKFVSGVDQVYVLISAPLNKGKATQAGMTTEFLKVLDKEHKTTERCDKETRSPGHQLSVDYRSCDPVV